MDDKENYWTRFRLAVARKRVKKEGEKDTDFFNCIAFGSAAKGICTYAKKGGRICVCGENRENNFEKDGVKYYTVELFIKDYHVIDFKEKKNGANILPIYIGIHTFYDSQSKMNLIYDWRAPISSMFYDYELGEATYTSPVGEISGDVSLKRQYRIRKGKMEYMIESSLTVHDEILQKELSNNADDKMRNIVTTIQREQNRIIRNEEAHILIIQGVAGSGKTSIALHRIAYLLYTLKGDISSKDILIISPNKVFGDYISNVLPELGEESVPETSMEQILSEVLENKYKYQSFFEQVTELLEKTSSDFIERIKYKSSFEFISQLDKFILYMENNYFKAAEVKLTRHITIQTLQSLSHASTI